jgi:hypothetical protein
MSEHNQIEIPPSFIALFFERGRLDPKASREIIESRYTLCEDMACMLTEHAQTLLFDQGLDEAEVLTRCHQGLITDASVISAKESDWVIHRLAELLCWAPPAPRAGDGERS